MLISLMTKAGWQRAFSLNLGSKQRNRRHKTGHFAVQESARVQTLDRSDMYVVVVSCSHSTLSPGQTIATCQHNISQHCWAQHVTCVWPPCCHMLGVVGSDLTSFKLEPTTPNMLQQIVTRWPNARNMYIHTYIHKLYLSSDFSVAYIASISDPNLLIKSYNIII